MERRTELYTLIGLIVGIIGVLIACVALPQTQPLLIEALKNPLFLPLIITIGALILALVVILLFADLGALVQRTRALLPWSSPERRYLEAIIRSFGQTPALLAARGRDDVRAELKLLESFSQLTLVRELGGGTAPISPPSDDSPMRRVPRPIRSSPIKMNADDLWQRWSYRIGWAIAQLALLGMALLILWLFIGWPPSRSTLVDWLVMLAWIAIVGIGWYLLARGLNDPALPWLVAQFIEWRSCVADPATPGAEIWEHLRLLILGGPGSGKTTLLRHVAFTCAHTRLGLAHRSRRDRVRDQYGWPTKPFPIYHCRRCAMLLVHRPAH